MALFLFYHFCQKMARLRSELCCPSLPTKRIDHRRLQKRIRNGDIHRLQLNLGVSHSAQIFLRHSIKTILKCPKRSVTFLLPQPASQGRWHVPIGWHIKLWLNHRKVAVRLTHPTVQTTSRPVRANSALATMRSPCCKWLTALLNSWIES